MTANSQAASTLYQAIVDDIRLMIQDHRLSPGDQLPPMGKLAERYNVSVITAKRAISELQQLGLVRSVRGKGTFIAGRSASKPSATKASTTLKSITLMSNNADAKNTRSFMKWYVYLAGEIHSDWREQIARGVAEVGLPVVLLSPITDHASRVYDTAGPVLH